MAELTYLQIRGTLAENMVYRAQPGHETTRAGPRAEADPAFQLLLLDGEGRILVSVNPQVKASGCQRVGDPLRLRVRATLPLHPDAVAYELRRGEVRLYTATIPPQPPMIVEPACRRTDGGLKVSWQPAQGHEITYSIVAAMESGRRIVLARDLTEPAQTVVLSRMPASGKGKLYVLASDGVRSSETEVASIEVPVRPPTAQIISPAADSRMPFGPPVSVLGCCLDMAGQPCPPELAAWFLDGERFATGSVVAVLDHARPGTHRLTLAYGEGPDRVESSVVLEIEQPDDDYQRWEELISAASLSETGSAQS
jgi:hypothetical protein